MRPALRHATNTALLLWWLPTIVLVFARPAAFTLGHAYRARRIHRLIDAGDHVEAERVLDRMRRETEAYRRRLEARRDQSPPAQVDVS